MGIADLNRHDTESDVWCENCQDVGCEYCDSLVDDDYDQFEPYYDDDVNNGYYDE